jgi:cytoskeletal protein CcmA (bactofilin family)
MAQIIKHRRGSILSLKDVSANVGELVVGTGSISDLSGPVLFVGHTAVNGGYNPVSKIYQGTNAPTISVGSHGSTMDGVPFYSTAAQTLYILDKSGNVAMDLTGNIEGNLISGVTINVVSGTTANYQNISGSFTGSGIGLYDIPASGITGLNLSQIADGAVTASVNSTDGFRVNTNSIISGSLTVTGSTYTNSDVYITGSTYQTGSINLTGDVILKGNISIGDSLTGDTVTLNGEISSSLIPAENEVFDLGTTDNRWREIHVHSAFIDNISISGISTTNLELPGFLTVSGTSTFSGSVLVEDLTEKRLVVAGANGQLTDYSGLTFDNGNLNLSGALEVTDIQGTGSLYLKPDKNDSRLFEIYNTAPSDIHFKGNASYNFFGDDTNFLKIDSSANTLTLDSTNGVIVDAVTTVNNDLNVTGSLIVTGLTELKSTLVVSGATTIDDTLRVTNNSSLEGTLSVTGSTTLNGSTYVTGLTDNRIVIAGAGGLLEDDANFTFDGTNFKIAQGKFEVGVSDGNIRTSGSLTVEDGITINGNQTVNGILTVTGATDLKSTLVVSGATTIDDTLLVTGNSSLEGTLTVTGSTDLKSTLVVSGATTIDDTLLVTGNSSLEGTLSVTGHTTLFSGLTVNGNETVNGVLTVTGNTELGGNLYVSGNLEVLGSATNVNIQSTTVEIGDNIILVNAYSPFQRYAGITAYDSGSVGNSGSLLYDSLNDYWLFQNSNATTSKIVGISGGTMGSEASLTSGTFPIADSSNTIKDSLLTFSGTTLAFNTNKFTVESNDGATTILGNVTLSSGGGADATNKTSAIVFKNSSNVLGYVSTTETTDVLDGILGYKNSNGALVFSTVIDGGTY